MILESPLKTRKQLYRILYFAGAVGAIFGVIHFLTFLSTGSTIALSDAGINAGLGVLELLAGWLISKGKQVSFIVIMAIMFASLIYGFVVGRGFNFLLLATGGFILYVMFRLRQQGGLS